MAAAAPEKKRRAKIRIRKILERWNGAYGEEGKTSNPKDSRSRASNVQRPTTEAVRHLYVHIPFCARICPYCAFYKERADGSQTQRFCEALLREIEIVGAGTPSCRRASAPTGNDLFRRRNADRADDGATRISSWRSFANAWICPRLVEWTIEANPGSVSPRKAALAATRWA